MQQGSQLDAEAGLLARATEAETLSPKSPARISHHPLPSSLPPVDKSKKHGTIDFPNAAATCVIACTLRQTLQG